MATVATAFGIEDALKKLGVQEINKGTSTGSNFFSEGEMISSYSPVDGKLIGKVTTTSREDYEKVINTAQSAFKDGELCRHHNGEKLFVSLEIN